MISYCYSTTVSIHAPTRGATVTYYLLYLDEMRFNPRSHEGSDVTFRLLEIIISQFQSTLPRGERHRDDISVCKHLSFNPRSHEGSDSCGRRTNRAKRVSIHAPTRGATLRSVQCYRVQGFQSTLPRGERRMSFPIWLPLSCFNPRSHEGSDIFQLTRARRVASFNPRSHEGSDFLGYGSEAIPHSFNPRSHEGSDCTDFGIPNANTEFQSTLPRGERR